MKLSEDQLYLRRLKRAENIEQKRRRQLAEEMIKKGYAQLARKHHPDAGGSTDEMDEIKGVRDDTLQRLGYGFTLPRDWHRKYPKISEQRAKEEAASREFRLRRYAAVKRVG